MNTQMGTCTQRVAVGAACPTGQDSECVEWARCQNTMCVERQAAGGACMADLDCLGQLVCDSTMHCALPPDPTCM
jgi:hypothetical protein